MFASLSDHISTSVLNYHEWKADVRYDVREMNTLNLN